MSHIWKAVTGFFKAKEKMEEDKKEKEKEEKVARARVVSKAPPREGDDDDDDGSDSDDEDFVPNEANDGALSEELSDDDVDDDEPTKKKTGTSSPRKRKRTNAPKKSAKLINGGRTSKRGRFVTDEEANGPRPGKSDEEEYYEDEETPQEDPAALEAQEKAETDQLWASFLTSVDEEKAKKNKRPEERTVEKVVNKVYDFAGEKVSVQEKVKVTVSKDSAGKSTTAVSKFGKNNEDFATASSIFPKEYFAAPRPVTASPSKSEEPQPGPSSAMRKVPSPNGKVDKTVSIYAKPAGKRKGGISILGNDPEAIGLDELDKRGLTGLLKAFENKAKRIGTLDKSKLDWDSYKRQQGLEEELHSHNKSRDTFIDKQEFLNRADHRQFELEKNMRATQRSKRLANSN